MTTGLQFVRRSIVALIITALIALSAAYGPVMLDEVAGVDAGTPAFACQAGAGGC